MLEVRSGEYHLKSPFLPLNPSIPPPTAPMNPTPEIEVPSNLKERVRQTR